MPWFDFGSGVYHHVGADRSMVDYGPGKANVPADVARVAKKRGKGQYCGKPKPEEANGEG